MLIRSIEIKNFLSYYESTIIDFNEGATIIIGQNNTGKSKLFDAYNWVLYDEAYKTAAETFDDTSKWKDELANRFAKQQCQINDILEVSVCLTFEDENINKFIVTRNYRIRKINDFTWDSPNSSEISITTVSSSTFNTTHITGSEANDLLNRNFPKNLSRYFLFQGESISRLLRLNQRSDFTKAIGELSGIKYFEKAKRYADKVYERAKGEFENKIDNDATIQAKKVELNFSLNNVSSQLLDLNSKLENEYKERDIKQRKLDEKVEELSRFEECAKLLQEIKSIEHQRDEKVLQKRQLFEYKRPELFAVWIYQGASELFDNFLRLYRLGKEEKKIPEPIRQDFILEMLQQHVCKVCGSSAPHNSTQYNHIASYVNEKSLDKEVALINALSDTADTMKTNISTAYNDAKIFGDELTEFQKQIYTLIEKIGFKEDELRLVTERIEDELKTTINRADIEKVNLVQLKKDRDNISNDLNQSKGKVEHLLGRKDETERSYNRIKSEYDQLIEKSTNDVERRRLKLAADVRDQIHQLHDNFLNKLISDIEEEANVYFKNMTYSNPALSGRVRVDYNNKEVYTVDEMGVQMTNINQANKVSLQISFVAAVLSVSNKIWEKHFPFVADAPISALGGNNKINAIKTIIEIFRQSIVILKDDADRESPESIANDQVRQLIKVNSKIHNAYELRMVGSTVANQITKMIKLK